ncbi:MAG: transcriptional regulator [Sphingopyxis sp.]|nr:transcriptional regulator [Sphingopyxis sp.]
MMLAEPAEEVIFGPFRLDMRHRKLFCGADEVRMGSRAMDILLALARQKGELVSKQQLFDAAWPGVFVQEANLKVTVAYLRRTLREFAPDAGYINNIVGRGYWLDTAPRGEAGDRRDACPVAPVPRADGIIGRDTEIAHIAGALAKNRLVTIVGAGGIGKTTVAQSVASAFGDDGSVAAFVDFSRIANDDYVASSTASALGISPGRDSIQSIVSILARQKMLLVFDTCEHVLSAVAHLCDVLMAKTRNVRILATSRQLLRARGEKVVWLAPLAIPPPEHVGGIDELLRFSAPRLLAARAAADGYRIDEKDVRAIARICRRLDGCPLAIELVATRLAAKGVTAVERELDEHFLSLRREGVEGPSRHQSLLLTLQWSYALLSEDERRLLRAISIFAGAFDAEAAVRVAADRDFPAVAVMDAIGGLRGKSMLCLDRLSGEFQYRLLDSTRAFAATLRDSHGETAEVAMRHARLQVERLGRAASEQGTMPADAWRASCGGLIDELRKALDWTLFRSADPLLGIKLVAGGLPLWHDRSLGEEARKNCERALAEFDRIGCNDASLNLALVVGLARVTTYVSADGDRAVPLFHKALRLTREMKDPGAECRVLGALVTYELMSGRSGAVFETLEAMREAARATADPAALWEEEQLRAQWDIRVCDFGSALARVEALFEEMRDDAESGGPRFQIHQRMNVEVQLAALNWLKGRPREAVRVARLAARDAEDAGHDLTLIHCLAQGIIWTLFQCREYEAARPYIEILRSAIFRGGLAAWIPVANCYDAVISAMTGESPDPERLRAAYADVHDGMVQLRHHARYAMFAEAMLANGQPADAARVIRDVFDASADPWGKPEFLRLRAATERACGRHGEAEATLREALHAARATDSPSWELRAAHDLAMLFEDRDPGKARRILAPAFARFGDGFETGDLASARALLARLC